MKRSLTSSLSILLLILSSASVALAAKHVPGDVLVVLEGEGGSRVSASSLHMGREAFRVASIAASSGAWVKDTWPQLSEAGGGVFALLHTDVRSADRLVEELQARPDVLAASPNYIVRVAAMPDDPLSPANELWGLRDIRAPEAWDVTTGRRDVHVAIIDTGIDWTCPDLAARVEHRLSRGFTTKDETAYMDDNGHGTHVAGIVGAAGDNGTGLVGTAWDVGLIALKAMDSKGEGRISDVIAAIDHLVGLLRADPGLKIAAVNLSLETYSPMAPTFEAQVREPLWRALKALDDMNGTLIVVAAGNYGVEVGAPVPSDASDGTYDEGDYAYLASYGGLDGKIAVAAMGQDGRVAPFSNWSPTHVELAAPGVEIWSTFSLSAPWTEDLKFRAFSLDDGTRVGIAKGTSMAAPHVAGAAALLMAADPTRTAWQIKASLMHGADGTRCRDAAAWGALDVRGALDHQAAHPDLSATPPPSRYDDYEQYEPYEYEERKERGGTGCDAVGQPGGLLLAWALLRRRR